jgi:hypothetical protein
MFGNKKETGKANSKSPFPLEVLTTEYFIEGTAEGDQQFLLPVGTEYWYPIVLTTAKITAAGWDNIPVRTVDRFEVKGDTVVAMIPRKDPTSMMQYSSYQAYKNPLKGTFFFGPYLFEGTLMSVGNDRFNGELLMLDTIIRHISPKSKLGEISAPHVLVNTRWMHGREVK